MKQQLIPAPLNQKDILEDLLFDELFDYSQGYVERDFCDLGFIESIPVIVKWQFNYHVIDIYIDERIVDDLDDATNAVMGRLDDLNEADDSETFCKYYSEKRGIITASFYYKSSLVE